MNYRSEIDGLRAVAVLPVILFHAGFNVFSGGFVGVDVFFVISGYLITQVIAEDLTEGRFSLLRFYERRARRLFPALFFVIVCCLPFAWVWMLPDQFKDFSQSIFATVFFTSNLLFWQESGYFSVASEFKPLLHTWSLAVEEQFYLAFPLLLIAIWRFGRVPVLYCIATLALASFLAAEWGARNAPAANFYLVPFRAWELLAGVLCALWQMQRQPSRDSNILSVLGLGLIFWSIIFYDAETIFPSAYTLVPVTGTALVLLFGSTHTWAGQFLSTRFCVGIGLISYSAYLWHQPLFAFARIRWVGHPDGWLMALLALVSLLLAWASWRYIEQPFRRGPRPLLPNRRALFGGAGLAAGALAAFGLFGHVSDGLSNRNTITGPFTSLGIEEKLQYNTGLHSACEGAFQLSQDCATGPAPEILLWGDSFAMHLAQGLTAGKTARPLRQHTMSACPAVLGIARAETPLGLGWAQACLEFNDKVYDWLRREEGIKYVVLSSQFGILSSKILTDDGQILSENQLDTALFQMLETVNRIRDLGKKPVVISPPPATGDNIGMCLFSLKMFGADEDSCDFARADFSASTQLSYDFMKHISAFVPVIMLDDMICPNGTCDTLVQDIFIYRDEGHLSKEGSRLIGETYDLTALLRTRADDFWAKNR